MHLYYTCVTLNKLLPLVHPVMALNHYKLHDKHKSAHGKSKIFYGSMHIQFVHQMSGWNPEFEECCIMTYMSFFITLIVNNVISIPERFMTYKYRTLFPHLSKFCLMGKVSTTSMIFTTLIHPTDGGTIPLRIRLLTSPKEKRKRHLWQYSNSGQ